MNEPDTSEQSSPPSKSSSPFNRKAFCNLLVILLPIVGASLLYFIVFLWFPRQPGTVNPCSLGVGVISYIFCLLFAAIFAYASEPGLPKTAESGKSFICYMLLSMFLAVLTAFSVLFSFSDLDNELTSYTVKVNEMITQNSEKKFQEQINDLNKKVDELSKRLDLITEQNSRNEATGSKTISDISGSNLIFQINGESNIDWQCYPGNAMVHIREVSRCACSHTGGAAFANLGSVYHNSSLPPLRRSPITQKATIKKPQ